MRIPKLFEYIEFTKLARKIRPKDGKFYVYDVNLNEPLHLSMTIKCGKFKDGELDETFDIVLSKEWFVEWVEKRLPMYMKRRQTDES